MTTAEKEAFRSPVPANVLRRLFGPPQRRIALDGVPQIPEWAHFRLTRSGWLESDDDEDQVNDVIRQACAEIQRRHSERKRNEAPAPDDADEEFWE